LTMVGMEAFYRHKLAVALQEVVILLMESVTREERVKLKRLSEVVKLEKEKLAANFRGSQDVHLYEPKIK